MTYTHFLQHENIIIVFMPHLLKPLSNTLHIAHVELHTTTKLTPVDKEYFYFQINGKSLHAAQCVKSRIINMAIDSILSIYTYALYLMSVMS